VREVVQRCETVKLQPLDNQVEAYLRHKFARVDANFDAIFDISAVDEIRNRLRRSRLKVLVVTALSKRNRCAIRWR
jgi:type II secretory pathway predicted ATPase ExeA